MESSPGSEKNVFTFEMPVKPEFLVEDVYGPILYDYSTALYARYRPVDPMYLPVSRAELLDVEKGEVILAEDYRRVGVLRLTDTLGDRQYLSGGKWQIVSLEHFLADRETGKYTGNYLIPCEPLIPPHPQMQFSGPLGVSIAEARVLGWQRLVRII